MAGVCPNWCDAHHARSQPPRLRAFGRTEAHGPDGAPYAFICAPFVRPRTAPNDGYLKPSTSSARILGTSALYTCRRRRRRREVGQVKAAAKGDSLYLTSCTRLQITCLRRCDTPLLWTSMTPFWPLKITTGMAGQQATEIGGWNWCQGFPALHTYASGAPGRRNGKCSAQRGLGARDPSSDSVRCALTHGGIGVGVLTEPVAAVRGQ